MVLEVLESAMNLKCTIGNTHGKRLDVLAGSKVMILQELNEPFLNMAVSKAATLLGAYDVNIVDNLAWDQDYMGRVFSFMADAIFVATMTHMCVQRFANQSTVPVVCMRSRTHASIQSLATMMAIIEEYGCLNGLNLAYFGPPHPVLNSYLLLCPILGINLKFMCCCKNNPVSPLLYKASENMTAKSHTALKACSEKEEVLKDATVIIAGPSNVNKINEFKLAIDDIDKQKRNHWIFFHTGPRGKEVDDKLFFHENSKTFVAFENFHYIAAALMANVMKDYKF
ncbi:putative ornithine carbamoyltransferase [Danaus plexippus plexippus]|uniref:ornithine carbamoyltransferase n=1 Tax=Danaus plexippus plexippus TaxID=278856 RepID=A0A212ELB4_DANPL|nr:putative ornithine carbamoyltransferase [Danaus plexippus plexippus]